MHLSANFWRIAIAVYALSLMISDYAVTTTLHRVNQKENIGKYENVKQAAGIMKLLCFVPVGNTIYAGVYILAFTYGFLFKRNKKTAG